MTYRPVWVCIVIAGAMACASGRGGRIAEWHDSPGTLIGGPVCADPSPEMSERLTARLAPLESIILRGTAPAQKVAAVRALEPAFQDFLLAEMAVCRLLERRRITVDQYDAFLDSVALGLPVTSPDLSLETPSPVRPHAGTVFSHYPRRTTLEWQAVPRAARYVVEVQGFVGRSLIAANGERTELPRQWLPERGGLHAHVVSETGLRFNFVGAQPGRWRVRALDAQSRAGPASQWRTFEYTR